MSAKGDFVLGNIEVHSTQNKGHDPEFWASHKKNCQHIGWCARTYQTTSVSFSKSSLYCNLVLYEERD